MKKFIAAVLAAAIVTSPVFAAEGTNSAAPMATQGSLLTTGGYVLGTLVIIGGLVTASKTTSNH